MALQTVMEDDSLGLRKLHKIGTISPRASRAVTISLPTVTGNLNRRGPALPGLK